MVYGSYSRGYRQGAVAPFSSPTALTFQPETLDTYEVGAKTTFHGVVSGRFNIAAFYSRLKKQQIQFGLQNSTNGRSGTSIFNAGRSRMDGAEFDSLVNLTDWLRVDAAVTYLDTKLISINNPGPFPDFNIVLPSATTGDQLPYSPMWNGHVSGTVTLPVPEAIGRIEASATYRIQSKFQTAASTSSDLRASPIKQVDLNLNWRDVAGRPVDLSVFATNVTNQKIFTLYTPLFGSFGFDTRQLGPPRMYGIRVRARFGEGVWK